MTATPIAAVLAAVAALSLAAADAAAQGALDQRERNVRVPGLTFTFGSLEAARIPARPRERRYDPAEGRVASPGDGPLDLAADVLSLPFAAFAAGGKAPLTRSPMAPGPVAPR